VAGKYGSLLPFRVFGVSRTASGALPPARILSWNSPVVQSIHSPRIADMSFTIPLRRWPFPRPCGFPWANAVWVRLTSQLTPLVDFSAPSESFSADPSRAGRTGRTKAGSSRGLRLPTAHSGEKGPLPAGRAKTRYVPPSGFGYPRDGFRPFRAWPGLFRPDSAPGILPFGAFPAHKVVTAFPQPPNLPAVNPTRSSSGQAAKPVRRASTSRL